MAIEYCDTSGRNSGKHGQTYVCAATLGPPTGSRWPKGYPVAQGASTVEQPDASAPVEIVRVHRCMNITVRSRHLQPLPVREIEVGFLAHPQNGSALHQTPSRIAIHPAPLTKYRSPLEDRDFRCTARPNHEN